MKNVLIMILRAVSSLAVSLGTFFLSVFFLYYPLQTIVTFWQSVMLIMLATVFLILSDRGNIHHTFRLLLISIAVGLGIFGLLLLIGLVFVKVTGVPLFV